VQYQNVIDYKAVSFYSECSQCRITPFSHLPYRNRNSKYQPFLQMSEIPVRRCGTVGSNTA